MVMNAFHPSHGGVGQYFVGGTKSEMNFDAVAHQWMAANTCMESNSVAQPLLCGAMVGNSGPGCMPMAWPIGQTAEGALMFASVVPPPSNASVVAKIPTNLAGAASSASMEKHRQIMMAKANPNRPTPDSDEEFLAPRRLRHGKVPPADSDALTSDEIEEMRLAVQKTFRAMQSPSSSETLESVQKKITCMAGARYSSKSKERDSDTLSSSSSTCIPESSLELLDNAADEDAHTSLGHSATAQTSISDAEVDQMLLAMECSSSEKRKTAMEWVVSSTHSLAFTRRGCRIVQRAMELATSADKEQIVENLQGLALDALQSPHANYVLQKCFEIASPSKIALVLRELKGHGAFIARHRFGCRVLQRALENCPSEQIDELITEILMETPNLVRHTYGNFVMQHILQYGTSSQVHQIAEVLLADATRFTRHRIAGHVISCAMSCCSPDDVQNLTEALGEGGYFLRRHDGNLVTHKVNRAIM
jgi:hypothetical protein